MRKLFDELVAQGEGAIDAIVAEGRQESVDLEFKTKEDPNRGEPSKDDVRQLGRTLSAFGNSIGGLIVWGVEARKDQTTGIDGATGTIPIASIERFKSDFVRACSQVIMPRHEGIRIEHIPSDRQPGAGYLAIYVERSERRPHRSEVSGDKQYYKRSGDSTIAMEHYDIEDSFKRLAVPTLELQWKLLSAGIVGGPDGKTYNVSVELRLFNSSSISARFPYVLIDDAAKTQPRNTGPIIGLADGSIFRWEGDGDIAIHPDVSFPIGQLALSLGPFATVPPSATELDLHLPGTIRYRCGSANARPQAGEIKIRVRDLLGIVSFRT
jgi:hypothetical protein